MAQAAPIAEPPTTPGEDLDRVVCLGKALGDPLRARILQALHQDSYSVNELCELFGVAQPALSHHLKILRNAGLVAVRREGNSIFYRRAALPRHSLGAAALASLDGTAMPPELAGRVARIHQARNSSSAAFFERNAAEIASHQAQICEPAVYADVVLAMLEAALAEGLAGGQALEVGPGSGLLLARLAGMFQQVVGVDNARPMLRAAQAALSGRPGIRLRYQDFMTLPRRRCYDALVAAMVVHHQASPAAFLAQAARVVRPGGALVVAELCRHDQEWASRACGDLWLGFEPEELRGWAGRAGLVAVESQYLAQKNGFRIQIHRFRNGDHHHNRTSNGKSK